MTDLLERAVAVARALPPETQDEIARLVLSIAGEEQVAAALSPAELASFAISLDEARREAFATDAEVRAIWTKHGL